MVVINNATPTETTSGSTKSMVNMILGLLLIIVIGVFLFYFLPPLLRGLRAPSTNISVPEQVDVNVNTPQQ
jgi:uncharacterized membrane protein YccC